MVRNLRRTLLFVALVASLFVAASAGAQAQSNARVLITQNVDEGQLVTLAGNTRPEATPENDRGAVAENLLLEHMLLQLKRSPEQEQALEKFIDQQYDPKSPNFHQWLTADQFGQSYGLAQQDLDTITRWLQSHGLVVNKIYPGGMVIDFSGTAAQVREAFRTEIHNLDVNGVAHISNMRDPQIPAALAPAVLGVVSLNDFRPHPMVRMRPNYTFTSNGSTNQAVVPADLETIYNLNPLFTSGISGQGQTVVLIEDTNVKGSTDWNTFRTTFGLSSFTGATFTQVQPGSCTSPGVNGDDIEALLDIEYSSAAAPSAAIELASCADTITTFGGLIAVQNLVSGANPPAVISMSYGECEALTGAAANGAFNSAFQQGSVEGISIFVSAGDDSASGCDRDAGSATHGIAITGWGETPYNVSVGGTDFGDAAAGTTSTYWNSTNTSTFGSAKSYIPEIPWDDSCASVLLANSFSFSTTYGSTGFCNSTTGKEEFLTTSGGSGGPSGCATGSPSMSGIVSGTCAGYAKPSWQSLVGVPNDGVRDIPDVSLFSANGVWGHYYLFCDSDVANGGTVCTGSPSGWSGAGGTSFASPILAAIQALVNQKTNSRQGNPNQVYYSLAATEYGSTGSTSCNSSLGNGVGSSCIFYDVTSGDMDVNCKGAHNCYIPSGTNGVLSTSNTAYDKAYGTTTGWDFATGIGTINAANLVNGWPAGSATPDFSLSATSPVTIVQGGNGPSTVTITPLDGFSGSVTLSASGLPSGVTAAFNPSPATTTSTLTLTATSTATTGTVTVTITGMSGALTHTTTISLTVNPASTGGTFALSASPTTVTVSQGGAAGTTTITITPQGGFTGSVTLSASGLPSGVTATFTPNPATSTSTLSLTASGTATVGTVSLRIVGTSGTLTARASLTLTVNSGSSGGGTFTLAASPTSVAITRGGAAGTSTITITPQSGFTGSVTLTTSALPSGVTATFIPNPATSTSTLSLTASSTATAGASSVTVTGTSGTIVKTATIKLRVQ